jgi:hypothetical protein
MTQSTPTELPPNPQHINLYGGISGASLDITAEILLAEACQPTSFDRVNTLWWTLALLRLATAHADLVRPAMYFAWRKYDYRWARLVDAVDRAPHELSHGRRDTG